MNRPKCPPHRCHHELTIGSTVVHTCDDRFLEPLQPLPALRLVKAAS